MMAKYWVSSYHNRMIHFKVKIVKIILLALLKLWSYTQQLGWKWIKLREHNEKHIYDKLRLWLEVLHLILKCLFFESVALSTYHYTNDNLFFLVPVSFMVDFTAHNCTYATLL
jgi:hypothetical protein